MIASLTITLALVAAFAALISLGLFFIVHERRVNAVNLKCIVESEVAQRRLEHDLALSQAERNRLLDALSDAFLLVDSTETVRFANKAAEQLFGGRKLDGRTVREVFLDPRLAASVFECLESREASQARVTLPQQASPLGTQETRGRNVWVIDAAPLPNDEGRDLLTRIVIRDVTSEHHTEQIRKDFVANASHELRTPMAIITGYLENLLDDDMVHDPVIARRFLSVMRKHADRISRIVEDMLVISRLESGEAATLNLEPFRLKSCVNDVLERLEPLVRSHAASVDVLLQDEGVTLMGDRFYWTQVLFNLIENALKQNPHPNLRVEVGCESTQEHHRIWVTDNGIGIPSSDLPHIFRRFYRVEKHHSQHEVKGTGLGLSIVKRAVEAHGGTITVSSTPGRETKFLMTVPRQPLISEVDAA